LNDWENWQFFHPTARSPRHPQQEIASTYPQQAIALFDLFQREDPLDREEGVKGDRLSALTSKAIVL